MTSNYINSSDKFLNSTYNEKLVEHLFIADILQTALIKNKMQIEISRAEIDISGYDLILECNKIVRHIQLKSSDSASKTSRQNVSLKLADKPSGCVIWIKKKVEEKEGKFSLNYLFYGDDNANKLPSLDELKTTKHTKANAKGEKKERASMKNIPKGKFRQVKDTIELLNLLFPKKQTT